MASLRYLPYLIAMESWQDQGIVLAVRAHGENGAIVSLLTEEQGRHAGYVRGAQGSWMRGTLEAGNLVDANWQARNDSDLGNLKLELANSPVCHFMQDPLKLAALQSACALCDAALPTLFIFKRDKVEAGGDLVGCRDFDRGRNIFGFQGRQVDVEGRTFAHR